MDMESIKAEAREAIDQELGDFRDHAAETDSAAADDWDAAVERIVARIESAAVGTDPEPFAIGSTVMRNGVRGEVINRREDDGEVHSILVQWGRRGWSSWCSPREVQEVGR